MLFRSVGLKGDDVLMGGAGDDTYVWNPGDGNDRIVDQQGDNVLRFGEGIAPDDVRVERDENHLYFVVNGERIQVENWFSGGWLYEVRFADGTVWPRHNINAVAERVVGTDGDDSLRGYDNTNDTLVGGRGNDTLAGGEGSDTT